MTMPRRFSIGERAIDRLRRRPAVSLTSPLTINRPVDALDAMDVASDFSHLTLESCRQLVSSSGFAVDSFRKDGDPFALVTDGPRSNTPANQGPESEIPWDPRNSLRCGPYFGIDDCLTSSAAPQRTLRQVHFEIELYLDTNAVQQTAYFAITDHERGLSIAEGNYLALYREDLIGTGAKTVSATLLSSRPVQAAPSVPYPSRGADYSTGHITTGVRPFWIWFGWLLDAGTGNQITDFNAMETRACVTALDVTMNGVTLAGTATIVVTSTQGAPMTFDGTLTAGAGIVVTSTGEQEFTYTGGTATSFTGCVSTGTGTMATGGRVAA